MLIGLMLSTFGMFNGSLFSGRSLPYLHYFVILLFVIQSIIILVIFLVICAISSEFFSFSS